jgi:hypothetical protein
MQLIAPVAQSDIIIILYPSLVTCVLAYVRLAPTMLHSVSPVSSDICCRLTEFVHLAINHFLVVLHVIIIRIVYNVVLDSILH